MVPSDSRIFGETVSRLCTKEPKFLYRLSRCDWPQIVWQPGSYLQCQRAAGSGHLTVIYLLQVYIHVGCTFFTYKEADDQNKTDANMVASS